MKRQLYTFIFTIILLFSDIHFIFADTLKSDTNQKDSTIYGFIKVNDKDELGRTKLVYTFLDNYNTFRRVTLKIQDGIIVFYCETLIANNREISE
jgi:hypothetical protein